MTAAEFRCRCTNRRRLVRMAGTWTYVPITLPMAECVYARLDGGVTVDDSDGEHAFIAPLEPEEGA